jgi:quinolinate synthase
MARNTLEKVRDCLDSNQPEIVWQRDYEMARQVLEKSLLN